MLTGILVVVALSTFCSAVADPDPEPLCANQQCEQYSVCRVMETCETLHSCTIGPTCINDTLDLFYLGQCKVGKPLLHSTSTAFEMSSCVTNNDCPTGFFCHAEGYCCRASEAITKDGSCPDSQYQDTSSCTDECLSDADCSGAMKCCQLNALCSRTQCAAPKSTGPIFNVCLNMYCALGYECKVDANNKPYCAWKGISGWWDLPNDSDD